MALDEITIEIADVIERLGRLVRSRGYACDLNPAQWEALRYLARCNRFSNNPSALAAYLGATKGTVSQTVSSLQRKGLLTKVPRPGQGRSLSLVLTEQGRAILEHDPQKHLRSSVESLETDAKPLLEALEGLMLECQVRYRVRSFGKCHSCRYFIAGAEDGIPHGCGLLGVPVDKADTGLICTEHAPRDSAGVS